jgi:uncharacterized protein YecA (UPF0149 family)
MSTQTPEKESEHKLEQESTKPTKEQAHVHGPNCNHQHHHHVANKPIKREMSKIGRNDKCYCGSQKKYKKCCG